jgi:DNA-binding LacI/PurR family transcriptional regulator
MTADAVAELAARGCCTALLVIDPYACDANAQMTAGFHDAVAARAGAGMVGATLSPSGADFAVQMRNAFAAGQRWDGILVDGVWLAEIVLEEAERAGLRPGTDFHLITTDVIEGATTRRRLETSAYTHQPDRVGAEAWRLLQALMQGEPCEQAVLVPYQREVISPYHV